MNLVNFKTDILRWIILSASILFYLPLSSQYFVGLVPRLSPTKMMSNTIGYTEITINYCSPKVNKRKIWGDQVPYSKIWRAGANEATKIHFSKGVTIQNKTVPAGSYSLFIIPEEEGPWTIILNNNPDQWGVFRYDEKEDLMRIKILPRFNVNYQEDLNYTIVDAGYEDGYIRLTWENIELDIEFHRSLFQDLKATIKTKSDSTSIESQWVIYLQGAEYLNDRNEHSEQALEWLNYAEEMWQHVNDQTRKSSAYFLGHIYWNKARTLFALSNYIQAMEYLKKVKSIDTGRGYFNRGLDKGAYDDLLVKIERSM